MIVKSLDFGNKTTGLLHYLYGPGKGEALGGTVHTDPRTIAAWDRLPQLHAPVPIPGRGRTGSGVSVKDLARELDGPLGAAKRVPKDFVGHITVSNHPDDPILTDAQWAEIAASTMANAERGAGPNDPDGVRWVAVRHDDTSIHIIYTRVRESGAVAPKFINFTKAWEGMRHDYERRFGLTFTGKADGTARRPYGQLEATRAKAARAAGDATARPETAELRHLCRAVSAEVADVDTYLSRLVAAGVHTSVERDDDGQLVSYRVGLSSRPDGEPILYDAAKLASELAPAALGERWAGVDEDQGPAAGTGSVAGAGVTPPPETVIRDAATVALRSATTRLDQLADEDAEAYAAAAGDFLHSAAAVTGDDVLREAAESYTRAGRTTRQDQTPGRSSLERTSRGDLARELRAASSVLSALARLVPPDQRPDRDAARLILATAAVVASVRAWHDLNQRSGQAAAAATARRQLRAGEAANRARTRVAPSPATVIPPVKSLGRPVSDATRYEPSTQSTGRGRGR